MPLVARSTRSASGSRARSTAGPGSRSRPSTCRSPTCRFADLMSERLGLPVEVDNDANCAVWAEARAGAAKGAADVGDAHDRHGDRRRARAGRRGCIAAGSARRPSSATWSSTSTARRARATARTGAASRRSPPGSALVREAALRVAREPDTPLGRALEDGRPLTGPLVTEMAFDGDPVAGRVDPRRSASASGVGIANLVNIFNPEVVVIGGGVIAAGELLLGPAREVMKRARARARPRPRPDRRRRRSAASRG